MSFALTPTTGGHYCCPICWRRLKAVEAYPTAMRIPYHVRPNGFKCTGTSSLVHAETGRAI